VPTGIQGHYPASVLKGSLTRHAHTLLGFAISKTTGDIFMQQLARERSWAPQLARTIPM